MSVDNLKNETFEYVDGSIVPANLNVDESMTISGKSIDDLDPEEIARIVETLRNEILENSVLSSMLDSWNLIDDQDKLALYKAGSPLEVAKSKFMPIFATKYNSIVLKLGLGKGIAPMVRSMVMVGLIKLPNNSEVDIYQDSVNDAERTELILKVVQYVPQLRPYMAKLQLLIRLNSKLMETRSIVANRLPKAA